MEELQKQVQENTRLILENQKLLEENQKTINKIYNHVHRVFIGKLLYWLFIIGISFGAYVYAKPYISNLYNAYQSLAGQVNSANKALTNPASLIPLDIDASILPDVELLNRFIDR